MSREYVLLVVMGSRYIADVPPDATKCVANGDGAPPSIKGLTFERTSAVDEDFGLPLFRRRSRQF